MHSRVVMDYMDWLGMIGGLSKVVFAFITGAFSGFANSNTDVEIM